MTTSTSTPPTSLAPRQWNNLIEALKNGSCIALLGPGISTGKEEGLPLNQQFAKNLTKELEKENISFDPACNNNLTYIMQRFTTIPNVAPSDPGYEAKNFYEGFDGQFNSIQKSLAELPFNLIINTSPDDAIVSAFKQAGKFETMFAYYNHRKEQKYEFNIPTAEAPLIFNLFGFYKDATSLVLTESDQVSFMKHVLRDQPPLPPKLLGQLDSHKTYLFIGFDWEQWNLRLLLEGLNLEKEAQILAHSHQDLPLRDITKDFYQSSFHFSFITDNILNFVRELTEKYKEDNDGESAATQKKMYIVSTPKDESFRDELVTNLKPLPIDLQHSDTIEAGADREETITQHINAADIILLMVSPDFLASDDLYKMEWPLVLKRHQEGNCQVIPVITRTCEWQQLTELTQMPLILPRKGLEIGKAIKTWEDTDEAYSRIVKEIQELN